MKSKILVSVVLTVFNEEKHIVECLESLLCQSIQSLEILIVDDGSRDNTVSEVNRIICRGEWKCKVKIFKCQHKGPGESRNFGASKSLGEILVFLDGDMHFSRDFLEKLVAPMLKNSEVIGTESQSEYLANSENYWAKCWNIGRFTSVGNFSQEYKRSMVPNRDNHGGVFRAIRRKSFESVGGFDSGGDYSDDETLGKKLGVKSSLANDAIFFHYNPDSMSDVWRRAAWIGSDRKMNSGNKKLFNLVKFSFPISLGKALLIGLKIKYLPFVFFKLVFDTSIWIAVVKSL